MSLEYAILEDYRNVSCKYFENIKRVPNIFMKQ